MPFVYNSPWQGRPLTLVSLDPVMTSRGELETHGLWTEANRPYRPLKTVERSSPCTRSPVTMNERLEEKKLMTWGTRRASRFEDLQVPVSELRQHHYVL